MTEDNFANSSSTFKTYDIPKKIELYRDTWKPSETKMKYHEQRLKQSGIAFWLSFCGSIAGFAVIVVSLVVGYMTKNLGWIGIVGGAVTECVSVLFYFLSIESNKKISEFFQELTKESNVNHSLSLANDVKDEKVKDDLLVKLSLHLSGLSDDAVSDLTSECLYNYKNQ